MSARDALLAAAAQRILVKDGAYGTMIQAERLTDDDFRGEYDLARDQKGNNDLLNLTRPDIVRGIAAAFIEAGADIAATNTFNANAISLADYGCEHLVDSINRASAALVREVVDGATADDGRRRFVAGAIGPTNKTLSLSPRVSDPGYREVDFDRMVGVYREQCDALIAGGVDFLLVETCFDTLNAKAAGFAGQQAAKAAGRDVPLMLSFTVTDLSGRNLSGHAIEAFWNSVRHLQPLTIGINCAFGAETLRPWLAELAHNSDALVMAYPNAGLPNDLGAYDERPETTAAAIGHWLDDGLVNIVGSCCGTRPEHIAAITAAVAGAMPRKLPDLPIQTRLAGMEPFNLAA